MCHFCVIYSVVLEKNKVYKISRGGYNRLTDYKFPRLLAAHGLLSGPSGDDCILGIATFYSSSLLVNRQK